MNRSGSHSAAPMALVIEGLCVEYPFPSGQVIKAASDVDLSIAPGEIHALVGESGAGKTTVGSALMGLLQEPGRIAAGRIEIGGQAVDIRTGRTRGIVQGRDIGAIFQDPMTSLNPLFTVESQLCETMRHHLRISRREAREKALELLKAVGIPEPERRLKAYPHQLSGGQRQRVVIAAALCCNPRLIVADEPTTALDVSIQAQILKLIRSLADERSVGVLLVTHNMGVVADVADQVTIMRNGAVVEHGPVAQVLGSPRHPYARALIGAVPRVDIKVDRLPVPSDESVHARAAREKVRGAISADRQGPGGTDDTLVVEELQVEYGARSLWPGRKGRVFRAVDGVSFSVNPGEIFGLVGESGCGKTTVANAIAGLVTPNAGSVRLGGARIGAKAGPGLRRALQMVFQDPYSALNPRIRVKAAMAEPIVFYRLAATRAEAEEDAAILLEAVGLDRAAGERFPHAFSGGQRQRIAIARSLALRPRFLVCDEPTSSLDVSVQAQILNLLKDLRDVAGLSILFISHDLAVIRQMCDRVAVMRQGRIVELNETDALFADPQHPYTRELLSLVPSLEKIARPHLH
jgi:peptide/nickel transport system ATP-binding protein